MATLRETLDKAIWIYGNKLAAARYAAAGEDYSNVDHKAEWAAVPDVDQAMLGALNEVGIKNKSDLAAEFMYEGISAERLDLIRTPYFEKKAETEAEIKRYGKGAYIQVKNNLHADPFRGFTSDDVYAVEHMFEILPKNEDPDSANYSSYDNWMKPIRDEIIEKQNLEKEEKELDNKIFDFFNIPNVYTLFGWRLYNKSPISVGSIQERVEMRKSLAAAIDDYIAYNGDNSYKTKAKLLARWYVANADHNSNVNIHLSDEDRKNYAA